jgi:adenosylhomocysteine nucleosidase
MAHESPTPSDVVVIVSADAEWRAVLKALPYVEPNESPLGAGFTVSLGAPPRRALFFHGGWGKIAAAASTQYVIHHCAPALLVNLGTCGGFEGDVQRGDVILASGTVVYDLKELMGDHVEHIAHYSTDIDLGWLDGPLPQRVIRARIVSADRDLAAVDIPRLKRDFGAIVADWESAAIAWVARRHGVRTLILRGVSDLVGPSGGEAYDGNLHVFEKNTESIMRQLIDSLSEWIARSR